MRTNGPVAAITAVAVLAVGVAHAQVKVGVRTEYASVLINENLNVFVTIENQTGGPIVINQEGGGNIDLRFIVMCDGDKHRPVKRSHDRPLVSRMMARDGETYEGMVDVAHAFDIGGEGRYTIVAEVEWKGRLYRSESAMVDIVRGVELTSTDAAIKGYEDLVRRYSLRYWNRDRYEHLFLTVEQPGTGDNLGVFDLGAVVRVFTPVVLAQSSGDVLVVHQSGPDRYTRTAFRSTRADFVFVDQVYLREDGSAYEAKRPVADVQTPKKPAEKRSWWSRLWVHDNAKEKPGTTQSRPRPQSDGK